MSFARDTILIFRRQLRLMLRQPAWLIIGLIQPILYLVFFGPLLTRIAGGGLPGFPAGNSYSFLCRACSSSSACSAPRSSDSPSSPTGARE